MEQGTLLIKLEAAREALPVVGSVVISRTGSDGCAMELTLPTDEDGLVETVSLDAPPRELSLTPGQTEKVYATYDIEARAEGFAPTRIEGVQIYSGVEAYLPIPMLPAYSTGEGEPAPQADGEPAEEALTVIPPPAIEGLSSSGPAPLSTCSTLPRVLSSVYIPQYITVHLGRPQSNAANETVSFAYYIKNVCSSEIYPTWVV